MYQLEVIAEANAEFEESASWYEDNSEGLGLRFIEVIRKKLESIQEFPEHYPKKKGNFREVYVKTFPFVIIYTFYKKEGKVVVTSIFHTSRNPKKKYRKKK